MHLVGPNGDAAAPQRDRNVRLAKRGGLGIVWERRRADRLRAILVEHVRAVCAVSLESHGDINTWDGCVCVVRRLGDLCFLEGPDSARRVRLLAV